jgi:hypothetical protein
MFTAASGLSSGNQVSTYQQNRTNANQMIDLTHKTNGQLKKAYQLLFLECERFKSQASKVPELEKENDMLRKKLLAFQTMEINSLKEKIQPVMKIAV